MKTITCILTLQLFALATFAQTNPTTKWLAGVEKNMIIVADGLLANKYETSNADYNQFLQHLKTTGLTNELKLYAIDSAKWRDQMFHNEPYVIYYHTHGSYANYPVVNVSYEAANAYLNWLTNLYNNWPKRKYKKVTFVLPTEKQWMVTAQLNPLANLPYPFGNGVHLYDRKGNALAKTFFLNQELFWFDSASKTIKYSGSNFISFLTYYMSPINGYGPNKKGFYNLGGNVAEMLDQKGTTRGGSWGTLPVYMQAIAIPPDYLANQYPNPLTGFRVFMRVDEY